MLQMIDIYDHLKEHLCFFLVYKKIMNLVYKIGVN
jgi:hypothetical protein